MSQQINNRKIEQEYINAMVLDLDGLSLGESYSEIYNSNAVLPKEIVYASDIYSEPEFECQLIGLKGMKFALPAACVSMILHEKKITGAPSDSVYRITTVSSGNENISVIDIRALFMNDYTDMVHADLLQVMECEYALCCDEILGVEVITGEDVCWRSADSNRPWLAGTVKKSGIALLDIAGIEKIYKGDNDD